MTELEGIIHFDFSPDKEELIFDNDECITGKLTITPLIDFELVAFTCDLNLLLDGSYALQNKTNGEITIDENITWKKGEQYTYDLELEIPQDFFSYRGNWIRSHCTIEFSIVPDQATIKTIGEKLGKGIVYEWLTQSFPAYTQSYDVTITNEGHHAIVAQECTLKYEYFDLKFYGGLAIFVIALIAFLAGGHKFGFVALVGSLFLMKDGLYRKITMSRLGNMSVSTEPENKYQFNLNLAIPNAHLIGSIYYALSLEETVIVKSERHDSNTTQTNKKNLYHDMLKPYEQGLAPNISIPIYYPESSLPPSINGDREKLEWYITLSIVFTNRLTYQQKVPIQLTKTRQHASC